MAIASAQQPMVYAGRESSEWSRLIACGDAASVSALAHGGRGSLSMLSELLRDAHPVVREEVARICGRLGIVAAPLAEQLANNISVTGNSGVVAASADSLRAIGVGGEQVVDALEVCSLGTVEHGVRVACARAWATLDRTMVRKLSVYVGSGGASRSQIATLVLSSAGELLWVDIVNAMRSAPAIRPCLEDSLLRQGWMVYGYLCDAREYRVARKALEWSVERAVDCRAGRRVGIDSKWSAMVAQKSMQCTIEGVSVPGAYSVVKIDAQMGECVARDFRVTGDQGGVRVYEAKLPTWSGIGLVGTIDALASVSLAEGVVGAPVEMASGRIHACVTCKKRGDAGWSDSFSGGINSANVVDRIRVHAAMRFWRECSVNLIWEEVVVAESDEVFMSEYLESLASRVPGWSAERAVMIREALAKK